MSPRTGKMCLAARRRLATTVFNSGKIILHRLGDSVHARLVQRTGRLMVGWIKALSEWWEPNAQLTEKDISPHFWPNGTMPNSAEFDALVAEQFDHYRLRAGS